MKFAHLADAHLGSWREPKMRELSTKAFLKAIDDCIEQQVDFIVFSGDLFNTSLPALDVLKIATKKLKELKEAGIPFYAIAGSHDFSPSGKTMIEVLEKAGLLINVCKGTGDKETKRLNLEFTEDKKTGVKITGILGRKGMLDKTYYENLELEPLEKEEGYKIFLFHTTLSELKPKHLEKIESQALSFLPRNFKYYAGGHIHHPIKVEQAGYGLFSYPGALFPDNFGELEKYGGGGYYLIEVEGEEQKVSWRPVEVIKHIAVQVEGEHKVPEVITFDILNSLNKQELKETIVTIRLSGRLERGKISDINFKQIFEQLYSQGAYFVMKNTSQLQAEEFEEIKTGETSPEEIEEGIIKEHLQQLKVFDGETELNLAKSLLQYLNTEKKEGETVADFQRRIKEELSTILNLKKEMGGKEE